MPFTDTSPDEATLEHIRELTFSGVLESQADCMSPTS
jgi:hypothetical protein